MGPVTKTVYGTIQVGLADSIYNKLCNDEDTKTTVYKTSCLVDTVASGNYANNKTMVRDKKKIQPGTGIEVGCADKGIMSQTRERKLPFDNVPKGTTKI